MRIRLRHILLSAGTAIFCAGSLIVRNVCVGNERSMTCKGIEISVEGAHKFVSEEDIRQYVSEHFGSLEGCRLGSIPLGKIENVLDSQSAIFKSQAWYTSDSLLHVSVTQRRPVARFLKNGTGFYVDDRGFIFPLHQNYTAPVPTVAGDIPVRAGGSFRGPASSEAEREWIDAVLKTLSAIEDSRIWEEFPDVTVNADSDLVLGQEGGQETIIIGKPSDIREKLSRVKTYYSRIKPYKPEGFYRSVNVKYKEQIVCRQK